MRTLDTRDRVLDAAERLLERGGGGFSMRDLAGEAGVSFATPFNQFGSKGAIMRALSARRIDAMRERLARAVLCGNVLPDAAAARVLAAVEVAVAVMLEAPATSRAVMGAVGAPDADDAGAGAGAPEAVSTNSGAFWAEALGAGGGLAAATRSTALAVLPRLLAVAFRGTLSFWSAGEIPDAALRRRAREAAASVLLGVVGRDERAGLLAVLAGEESPA